MKAMLSDCKYSLAAREEATAGSAPATGEAHGAGNHAGSKETLVFSAQVSQLQRRRKEQAGAEWDTAQPCPCLLWRAGAQLSRSDQGWYRGPSGPPWLPPQGLINGLKLQQLNQLNTKTVKSLHASAQMLWHQLKPACHRLHLGALNEGVPTWEKKIAETFPCASQLPAGPSPASPWS